MYRYAGFPLRYTTIFFFFFIKIFLNLLTGVLFIISAYINNYRYRYRIYSILGMHRISGWPVIWPDNPALVKIRYTAGYRTRFDDWISGRIPYTSNKRISGRIF
jgi:hypothetical protein